MPLTISTDRGFSVIDPATLSVGDIVYVSGTVPTPVKTALMGLGLVVTYTRPEGIEASAVDAVRAMVYNPQTTVTAKLASAASRGWSLIPTTNVSRTAPTYT